MTRDRSTQASCPVEIIHTGEKSRSFDAATGIERLDLAHPTSKIDLFYGTVPPGDRRDAHKPGTC